MSSPPSIRTQVAELIGEDLLAPADYPSLRRAKPERISLCQAVSRCPRPGIVAAEDKGQEVAVAALTNGSIIVLPDVCPHDGGLLSSGFVDGNTIVCARHGWEFDGTTGICRHRAGVRIHCEIVVRDANPADS